MLGYEEYFQVENPQRKSKTLVSYVGSRLRGCGARWCEICNRLVC